MNMDEVVELTQRHEERIRSVKELLCFAGWIAKIFSNEFRRIEKRGHKIKVSCAGKVKMVEVGNCVDFLLYELDKFISVSSGIACKLQMDVRKQWELLRLRFNGMEEAVDKDECITK
jgi:hypothetical protein